MLRVNYKMHPVLFNALQKDHRLVFDRIPKRFCDDCNGTGLVEITYTKKFPCVCTARFIFK